jgi:hypothetical protein
MIIKEKNKSQQKKTKNVKLFNIKLKYLNFIFLLANYNNNNKEDMMKSLL